MLKGRILAGKVLVKPFKAEEKTEGGLYIPDSAKEKQYKGKVILTGTGKKNEPMEVGVSNVVSYFQFAGTEITIGGENYLLLDQSNILYITD